MSTRATRTLSARGVRRLQDAPRFRSAGLRSSPSPLSRPDAVIARRQMFRSPTRVSAETDAARRPAPLRGGGGGRSAPARSCWKNLSASRSQNASSIGAALSAVSSSSSSSIDRCARKIASVGRKQPSRSRSLRGGAFPRRQWRSTEGESGGMNAAEPLPRAGPAGERWFVGRLMEMEVWPDGTVTD